MGTGWGSRPTGRDRFRQGCCWSGRPRSSARCFGRWSLTRTSRDSAIRVCARGAYRPRPGPRAAASRGRSAAGATRPTELNSDGSGATSKVTHYVVTYRRASGSEASREVASSVYSAAGGWGARGPGDLAGCGGRDHCGGQERRIRSAHRGCPHERRDTGLDQAGTGPVVPAGRRDAPPPLRNHRSPGHGWVLFGYWPVLMVPLHPDLRAEHIGLRRGLVLWVFCLMLAAFCVFGSYNEGLSLVALGRWSEARRSR